jgi:hypothetical protein
MDRCQGSVRKPVALFLFKTSLFRALEPGAQFLHGCRPDAGGSGPPGDLHSDKETGRVTRTGPPGMLVW